MLLKNPEARRKIVAVIAAIILLLTGVLGSCNVVNYEGKGEEATNTFSMELIEKSAFLSSGDKIKAQLLFATYARLFSEKEDRFGGQFIVVAKLILCFLTTNGEAAEQDTDVIFDSVEQSFDIHINPHERVTIIKLSELMPDFILIDRSILLTNLLGETEKNNIGLCNFSFNALNAGSGYVLGGYGQDITMSWLRQQQKRFIGNSEANLTDEQVQYIYDTFGGKMAFDCIGLIKAYLWIDVETGNINYASNGYPDLGANATNSSAVISGDISSIPDIPGLCVWMPGHIGVYLGNGEVIEANGNRLGVVKRDIGANNWTRWIQLPNVKYVTSGTYQIDKWQVTIENGRAVSWEENIVMGKGGFAWPLPKEYGKGWITSHFGGRIHPIYGNWEGHGGTDIGAPRGTPIYASAAGKVIMAGWDNSYGYFVKIEHSETYSTLYAHSSALKVRVGQYVKQGDTVALVGSTGDSNGNHLHFEIREHNSRVNPMNYF